MLENLLKLAMLVSRMSAPGRFDENNNNKALNSNTKKKTSLKDSSYFILWFCFQLC